MPQRFEEIKKSIASLEADFYTMVNSIPQLAWMARPDGWIFWYNQRWFDYTGTDLEQMQGWGWRGVHHPGHVERVIESIDNAFKTGEPWEDLFPLRSKSGEYRWFLSRAMPIRDEDGKIQRWFGTNTDVTEQKKYEERQSLLMREIDHRAKNALSVAQSIVTLTQADSIEAYKSAVEGRIAALSRAHSLLAASRWDGANLESLLRDELSQFIGETSPQISYSGPSIILEPASVQLLGLIVHELASNAARHGALSVPTGQLDISWTLKNHEVEISWVEKGLSLDGQPSHKGFGTTLLDRLSDDSGEGSVERHWTAEGLTAIIHVRTHRAPSTPQKNTPIVAAPKDNRTSRSLNLPSVLIAEDEVLTAIDLEHRLGDAGYRVIGPANTVAEARTAIEHDLPKIALLDANLGGERSYGLAAELRAAGVEIVFCTGYEELENLPEGLEDCLIVSKPFRDETLLGALQTVRQRLEHIH